MPYESTQCHLPPGRGDFPAFNPIYWGKSRPMSTNILLCLETIRNIDIITVKKKYYDVSNRVKSDDTERAKILSSNDTVNINRKSCDLMNTAI